MMAFDRQSVISQEVDPFSVKQEDTFFFLIYC